MKQKFIFLMIICAIFLGKTINVYAADTSFYEGEYINIYMNKQPSTDRNTIYYQRARYFRESNTKEYAYCIEPEKFFNEGSTYNYTENPYNLNYYQKERIKQLGYFGFLYPGHETVKWYAITQLMMWQTADPNGDYYFTDSLNGNRINKYTNEINEINNLINNYLTKPNLIIPKVIKANKPIEIIDSNNVLSHYKTNIGRISGNKLIIDGLKVGEYTINLTRSEQPTGKKYRFYESNNSQNMFERGDIEDINISIPLKVIDTSLKIIKVNKDTKKSEDVGKASLVGTTFELYDEQNKLVKKLVIDESGTCILNGLDFGTYKLKEVKAGKGYKLNDKEYLITINGDTPTIELTLENDIIKKEITIHKTYGDINFIGEANVTFEIYDENNNLVQTVTTDENGYIKTTLTYGTYTLKQVNSKEGYQKLEPITITVENEDNLLLELQDYKIKVPNTYTKSSFLDTLIKILLSIIKIC